jgi:hypothetical protein
VEDIEYRLCLEVKNRHIRTYVNGVLYNDTVDSMPELEELYITSSIDKNTDETILKVVKTGVVDWFTFALMIVTITFMLFKVSSVMIIILCALAAIIYKKAVAK